MSDDWRPRDWRPPSGLGVLMAGLIDYAGLFPPAGLGMADAAARYHRYRQSAAAAALGRFVVPVARLEELEAAVVSLGDAAVSAPWALTALLSSPPLEDLSRVGEFNDAHGRTGARWPARIDSVETKIGAPGEIERACAAAPEGLELYFEVPGEAGVDELCEAAARAGQALKIRTGGTTVDAFPPSAVVARLLCAFTSARVPFKATAGLHHPVRSAHRVTYDASAPRATMHGFLNVFVAASLLHAGRADASVATQVLEDEVPSSFCFDDQGLSWRGCRLTVAEIGSARRFARSFGSCSFTEPIDEVGNPFSGSAP